MAIAVYFGCYVRWTERREARVRHSMHGEVTPPSSISLPYGGNRHCVHGNTDRLILVAGPGLPLRSLNRIPDRREYLPLDKKKFNSNGTIVDKNMFLAEIRQNVDSIEPDKYNHITMRSFLASGRNRARFYLRCSAYMKYCPGQKQWL